MPNKEFQVGDTVYEFPDSYDDAKVQGILTKQGVIKGAPKKSSGAAGLVTGVLGSLNDAAQYGKGILKEAGREAENFEDISTLGVKPLLEKAIPPLGKARKQREDITELRTPGEKTGSKILQGAELVAPIPGVSELKAGATAGRLARAGVTALRGGLDMGIKTAVQTGNVREAAETGAVAGAAGAAMEAASGPVSKILKKWSRAQYSKVLHPLGRKAKELAGETAVSGKADDLVGRGVVAGSKEGLQTKIDKEVTEVGKRLEAKYQSLDATSRVKLKPIYDALDDYVNKNALMKNGAFKEGGEALYAAALKKAELIDNALGPYMGEAKPSDLWELRKSLDKYVYSNGLTADESVAAANEIREHLANSIRSTLNDKYPDLKALNNQYHLWRSASTLIQRNITNEIGKYQFAKTVGILGRGTTGALLGGAAAHEQGADVWGTATAAALGGLAMESTGWRTVSAVTKDKIANLIASGQGQAAATLAARAAGVSVRAAQ